MEIGWEHLLTTTRAVRRRLDFGRPVPRDVLLECVRIAIQAPTGANRQDWHFLFVDDTETKRAIAELYREVCDAYRRNLVKTYPPGDVRAERSVLVWDSVDYLGDRLHEVPALLIPCVEGRLSLDEPANRQAAFWGSILPAVWSFMLAARAHGLGTTWTTFHLGREREAAALLGIPYERVTQAGLIPVAYYTGEDFRPAHRLPVEQVVHWGAW